MHFIPSALVILLPPSGTVYSFILEVEGYPGQFFTLALAIGLIWLRFKRPDLKRPFKAWIGSPIIRIVLAVALISAPFFPPKKKPANGLFYATYAIVGVSMYVSTSLSTQITHYEGQANRRNSMAAGLLYWFVWTRLIPRWRGYRIEEETEVLSDGTSITKLVHKKLQ